MSSPSEIGLFEDGRSDPLKFIKSESLEQLTPLITQNSRSHTSNGNGSKLFWAVLGNDKISVVLKSVKLDVLGEENLQTNEDENRDSSIIDPLANELTLLSKLHPHQNIITFFGLTKVPENDGIFSVTQYVTGGNLRQYLRQQNSILSWNDKIRFSEEIASGLHHIHGVGLSHRNLHPNNILVQDGHMVISDFGCSSSLVHLNEMIPFIEPLYLKDQSYCLDRRSDIYSFGGIMSELSCGRPPFELFGSNYQLLINLIVNGDRDSSVISGAPVSYTQLYRRCWDADPSKRPTIENVMKLLTDIRSEFPKVLTKSPADIPHQANPRHHAIKNIQSLSVPAISPRVDSIGWRDSMGDFSEYDVISKEEVKGYSGSTRKVNSVPLVGGVSLNSRRRVKARSLSFGTPRKSLQVQRAHESAHLQLHHSMSMIGGINNEYLNIGANAPLFDNNQPKVILIARYCPGKSIVKVFDQLKRRKIDLTSREAYKSKSVFHSLIWNDDLFEVTGINHSQQKPARHSNFRAALKWLISNNLDINSVDDFGWTALHEAIWKRKEPGVILALLENQANPNIPDKLGATPLHQCLDLLRTTTRDDENRHIFTIIKLLLQYGADPNLALPDTTLTISGSSFPNCLFAAIYMDLPLDIIELMIKQGADTTSTTFRGLHLLDFAAKMNNVVALNYLTDNKNSSNTSKRSSIFNSLRINSRVGSMGSIPIKYEKGGRKKRWSIIRSI